MGWITTDMGFRPGWDCVPVVEGGERDGGYVENGRGVYDNRCRVDERFVGSGSCAVSRLGGKEFADHLVETLLSNLPPLDMDGEHTGTTEIEGVLFDYCVSWRQGERTVLIVDAELVAPSDTVPTPLLEFFADIWERRAQHAQAIAADLIAELKRRGMRDGMAEYPNTGDKVWWRNGHYHREDGPAVEYADGGRIWVRDGLEHREDGPAAELADGETRWCINGGFHREDGPAWEQADGSKLWYRNGKLHREDGPAVIGTNGYMAWYENDVLLRCVEPQRKPGIPPPDDGS